MKIFDLIKGIVYMIGTSWLLALVICDYMFNGIQPTNMQVLMGILGYHITEKQIKEW
jgi:hypothetical protein